MKHRSLILGALLFAPAIGFVVGKTIDTRPLHFATDVTAALPDRPTISVAHAAPQTSPRLPDHYAMETPEGRVEVSELAMRGRHSDRYRSFETWRPDVEENLALLESRWDSVALDARAARALEEEEDSHDKRTRHSTPEIAHYVSMEDASTGEAQIAETTTAEPALTGPETEVANIRVIDVESELALQR